MVYLDSFSFPGGEMENTYLWQIQRTYYEFFKAHEREF